MWLRMAWHVRLTYDQDGTYKISQSFLTHNHPLLPPKLVRRLPANREIPEDIKREILLYKSAGIGISDIQNILRAKHGRETTQRWAVSDVYNIVYQIQAVEGAFQADKLLARLQQLRADDPEFAFEFEIDENQRLKHVAWVFPSQKRAYARWHDTLVFDNTYKCNYFSMPFAVFTGVTNNGLSYCAAGALTRDETQTSFEWVFEAFLRMFGTAPCTILTNNDLALSEAIRVIFTNRHGTKHGLCIWHLLKNVRSNMTAKLGGVLYKSFHRDLIGCLDHHIDEDEFEIRWNRILDNAEYGEARSYLSLLGTWRKKWAPAYLKGFFFADTHLPQFLSAFEYALERRHDAEEQATLRESLYPNTPTSGSPIERQAASCLTKYAFAKFPEEWREKDAHACELIEETSSINDDDDINDRSRV